MSEIEIRHATIEDSEVILRFISDLAIDMRAEKEVLANLTDLQDTLFGSQTTAKALICNKGKEAIGFAVYFFNYSTWLGKHGLYLEDLYISPNHRGFGAGKVILKYLARLAVTHGCGRFEWCVHEWNDSAIKIYNAIGAKPQSELLGYRLDGSDLRSFANEVL